MRVNLDDLSHKDEHVPENDLEMFVGGEALGIKYLYDEVPAGADPLGPENRLIFMTGPLTGTLAPTSGRHCVVTKSPLTGCQTTAHAGGYWGTWLKLAGYDGIIVSGKSSRPVFLFIDDGKPEFYEAADLWGRDVIQTDVLIKSMFSDPRLKITYIGPAGENLVRYASILNDQQRQASRGGAGAVMGSKNLKAIAVRGTKSFNAARPAEYFASMNEMLKTCFDHPVTGCLFPKYGISGIIGSMNEHGALPTRNFRTVVFEGADRISGQYMAETILERTRGCFCCPINCTRIINIPYGPYHGTRGKGQDYEATVGFGSLCGNDNIEAIAMASFWCDQYGLDPAATSNVIAWAMDLYERGIIDRIDTRGIELKFGNREAMVAMIPKIAQRMEFGAILAEGINEAARRIGKDAEKYVLTVKNMPVPGVEARGCKGMGLSYAVDNRGADDLRPFTPFAELLGYRSKELGMPDTFDPLSESGISEWLVPVQNYVLGVNSLVCCLLTVMAYTIEPGQYAKHLSAVTGFDYDKDRLLEVGERAWNLQRMFNIREGITRDDDTLPGKISYEPLPEGHARGSTVRLDLMLDEYYLTRGWDRSTGWPTKEKLLSLGLKEAAEDIERMKKAPASEAEA